MRNRIEGGKRKTCSERTDLDIEPDEFGVVHKVLQVGVAAQR
jgi:hypothetical protein